MRMAKLLAGVCAAVLALSGATAWGADVTPDRLLNAGTDAEAGNWLMVGKTYNSNRFSTLNEINAGNVAGLHVVTAAPIGGTEPGGFGVGARLIEGDLSECECGCGASRITGEGAAQSGQR